MRARWPGTTAAPVWIALFLAAVHSHDASSRDASATGAEPVQVQDHVYTVDAWSGLVWKRSSTLHLTGPWTFGQIARPDIASDGSDSGLFGLFTEGSTLRDSMPASLSRHFDSALSEYSSGSMLALGYSAEFGVRRDILYANGYWAEGEFRRFAGSRPLPPRPVGLSFSHVGMGGYRPALWPRPLDSAGFAVGVQASFAGDAANWAVELGHRHEFDRALSGPGNTGETALTTRAEYRFAERFLLLLDAHYAFDSRDSANRRQADVDDRGSTALRVGLKVDF